MITEIDFADREVDFEEFISAIIDKLGDKVNDVCRKQKMDLIKFLIYLMKILLKQ